MGDKENPLYVLDGKKLGKHTLRLGEVKKGAFAGVVMFSFRWFKDWYFAEDWKEGGPKLQGEKPLNDARKREKTQKFIEKVTDFLCKMGYLEPEIEEVCKKRGLKILEKRRAENTKRKGRPKGEIMRRLYILPILDKKRSSYICYTIYHGCLEGEKR